MGLGLGLGVVVGMVAVGAVEEGQAETRQSCSEAGFFSREHWASGRLPRSQNTVRRRNTCAPHVAVHCKPAPSLLHRHFEI